MKKQPPSLILKDIQELSQEIEITKHSSQKFLLEIKNEQELKFLEVQGELHLLFKTKKNASLDLAIVMKEQSSLTIEAELEENSFLRITNFSNKKTLTKYYALCKNNSRFEATNLALSSINSDSKIKLKQNASCTIKNSYYNDEEESKINDAIFHEEKNTHSLMISKGYLVNSKSDSQGLIRIEPEASDAEGSQESNALLEGKSKATSIPDLEILNNEVKCSHGSTISRIKDEDLFYFEARGITKKEAKKMLIKGHLLSLIPNNEELKSFAESFIERGIK